MKRLLIIFGWLAALYFCIAYIAPVFIKEILAQGSSDSFFASPDCLASDKLRIKLGKYTYAIPRENWVKIYPVDPYETIDISSTKLCQEPSDQPIEARQVMFAIEKVIGCGNKPNCVESQGISIILYESGKKFEPYNVNKLREECLKRPYFNTCEHRIYYRDLQIQFMYYLRSYPVEELENTINKVTSALDSYIIE